ncbi:hypothetical protein AVEN_120414-1 [Araneus ventricosus]|uniref:Uncharacterized protein n=1 Tax=Araneus ventricosus TaxID=182803 RepID=A0A4Y2MYI7_ARAVE|nr:hypothetical protein AVEN_120414-1 [Araneus ventricosus]
MLSRIENEHDFLNRIILSDEATFHVSNKVNISTTAEFGTQKIPIQYRKWKETVQKSMSCALLHDTVIGQFFLAETSVTANIVVYCSIVVQWCTYFFNYYANFGNNNRLQSTTTLLSTEMNLGSCQYY